MSNIIQLLPDVVANQIAAGEVIQRPASALKELMENAIDAGSSIIRVVVREAGKALIQVIDNGCGMSETDARMSFERYATSKITKAEDLYAIRTMGFRGEALASIAAISQVELKTRQLSDETGIQLIVEGNELMSKHPVACNQGTSISVKNLFFNVPARRNFLKSNAAEMRYIIEEFQRIALAHPSVEFSLHHNDTEVFNLKNGNFRQRIAGVFGLSYNERLVPVNEETTLINISGYVGKPSFAKKIRGEQYFFVNQRFVKDPYLNHAVANAFEDLLPPGCYPSYFIFLDIDPAKIDINIHPTKTEIKFEDDKSVYAILRASVKRALGKFNISPTLDFEQETTFNLPLMKLTEIPVPPKIQINPLYNPFKTESEIRFPSQVRNSPALENTKGQNWSSLYAGLKDVEFNGQQTTQSKLNIPEGVETESWINDTIMFQLASKYIILSRHEKLLVVDQVAAYERVIYEKNISALQNQPVVSQQLVFPQTMEFNQTEFSVFMEIKTELHAIGFDISEFGKQTLVVHGIPSQLGTDDIKQTLEKIAEQYLYHQKLVKPDKQENVARSAAIRLAARYARPLHVIEMKKLVFDLFSTRQPEISLSGKPVFFYLTPEEIYAKFN